MRLIRGASGSGKTALIFGEFKAALASGSAGVRLVVPTSTLVRHYQHELARDGCVFPPTSVVSFSRFIADRALPLKAAPEGLLGLLVRNALRSLSLPEFGEVAQTRGMAATILETISLFENAGCTPEKLSSVRRLTAHARGFAAVWRAVGERLNSQGYASQSALVRAAAANTTRERIWMDGFVNVSPIGKELLRALSQTCDLTLIISDGPAGEELRRLALELGAKDCLLPGRVRRPVISLAAATSMEREADEIARRIVEHKTAGVAFREMAIVIRDERSYLPLIRTTLDRFGIPARYYFSRALDRQPATRFLGGLIECVLGGWEFGAALDAFRALPGLGTSPAFDRFDFKVREALPGRGLEALATLCDADLSNYFLADAWRDQSRTPADWHRCLERFMGAVYRPGVLEPGPDFGSLECARSHVAALKALSGALEQAADFLGTDTQPVSLAEFWQVACEAIAGATIQIPDDRRNVVHVIDAFEARQWDVTALFVCGLTDRDYPKKNPQNLLFPDADIDLLHRSGIRLRKAADQDLEERPLFESLCTRASGSLVLTYPLHNAGGATTACSGYLRGLGISPAAAVICRATPAAVPPGAGLAGRVDSPALLTSLAERHRRVSLSALEDLAQCRFKFFAGRTLSLKGRPERPQERLQPRASGLILHEALEVWLNEGRRGDFVQAFETAFEKAVVEKHLPPGYRLETERIGLRGVARGVRATDRWSGESQTEVELSLDFPGGTVVTGRVDRIDRLNERDCIIIDYKSGLVPNVRQMVQSPVKLQGPLYALAARERLNLNTLAMMYIAVREDKLFGWGCVPGIDLGLEPMPPRWMEDARDRAVERLVSLLSGAVHADPVEAHKCHQCNFKFACRFSRQAAMAEVAQGA